MAGRNEVSVNVDVVQPVINRISNLLQDVANKHNQFCALLDDKNNENNKFPLLQELSKQLAKDTATLSSLTEAVDNMNHNLQSYMESAEEIGDASAFRV